MRPRRRSLDIALYQPDIAQNTGTILRLGACLGLRVHIIRPTGYPLSARGLRRAGMDYLDHVDLVLHDDFAAFDAAIRGRGQRLVLLTTRAAKTFTDLTYRKDDVLLFGQESAGVPDHVHERADMRARIAMQPGMRSLNVAMAAAMVAGEAIRQTAGIPEFLQCRAGKDI